MGRLLGPESVMLVFMDPWRDSLRDPEKPESTMDSLGRDDSSPAFSTSVVVVTVDILNSFR